MRKILLLSIALLSGLVTTALAQLNVDSGDACSTDGTLVSGISNSSHVGLVCNGSTYISAFDLTTGGEISATAISFSGVISTTSLYVGGISITGTGLAYLGSISDVSATAPDEDNVMAWMGSFWAPTAVTYGERSDPEKLIDGTTEMSFNDDDNIEFSPGGVLTGLMSAVGLSLTTQISVTNAYINGTLYYSGSVNDLSDERLKANIHPETTGLKELLQLEPVTFFLQGNPDQLQHGFIAQDVQPLFPNLIKVDERGYYSMNYIGLVGPMIRAIQELKARNDTLREKITQARTRLEELEELVTSQ